MPDTMNHATGGCGLAFALAVGAVWAAAGGAHAQGATVYLAFGDSITEGDGVPAGTPGYPARLQRILTNQGAGDVRVENHGLGAEKTTGGLTRLDGVLAGGGDVLLLMEGTNDISEGISRETTVQNLDRMAQKAAARGLSTIHATVIPRIPSARADPDNQRTARLNYDTRELALDRDRRLADPFAVFLSRPNRFRNLYSDLIPNDQVGHPNADGYELLARIFADVILELDTVPPVPLQVLPVDGATEIPRDRTIVVELTDFGTGVDAASAELRLNGQLVDARAQVTGERLRLRYSPSPALRGTYEVSYRAADFATPANSVTRTVSRFRTVGTGPVRGDLNDDGQVDGHDLVILGFRFGARRGRDDRYVAAYDLTHDGALDGEDLAILAANFGRRAA